MLSIGYNPRDLPMVANILTLEHDRRVSDLDGPRVHQHIGETETISNIGGGARAYMYGVIEYADWNESSQPAGCVVSA